MRKCCVINCKSEYIKGGLSFHEFPSNQFVRKKWLGILNFEEQNISSTGSVTKVCGLHFRDDDFVKTKKFKRLKKNAIPSILPQIPDNIETIVRKSRRLLQHVNLNHKNTLSASRIINKKTAENMQSTIQNVETEFLSHSLASKCNSNETNTQLNQELETKEINILKENVRELEKAKKVLEKSVRYLQLQLKCSQKKITSQNRQLTTAQEKIEKFKEELTEYKTNKYYKIIEDLVHDPTEQNKRATFLLEQISSYKLKRPRYSDEMLKECVVWQHKSPRGYEHARKRDLLKLPSKTRLSKYVGSMSNETGVTSLIKERLLIDAKKKNEHERVVSLVIDEMSIAPKLMYDKQLDCFFGEKSTISIEEEEQIQDQGKQKSKTKPKASKENSEVCELADHLLCFVLAGISTRYRLPCAFFFTRRLTGKELHILTLSVIKEVESCGFFILRLVTDDLSVNVAMFTLMCNGTLKHKIPHPFDETRVIFLSFDSSHILKRISKYFFERFMTDGKDYINGIYVKILREIQMGLTVKPVKFLNRKHVNPSSIEMMNVRRAMEIFSPPVVAAIEYLKENPLSHPRAKEFGDASATIKYMSYIQKWHACLDVSNRRQYIETRRPNTMHFFDLSDERLDWLENDLLEYMETIKCASEEARDCEFITQATYDAFKLSTLSAVHCIKHLLNSGFHFVLTRHMSGDAVELFFSALRQSVGGNDILDARATTFSISKIIKTGIAQASTGCNVPTEETSVISETPSADEQAVMEKNTIDQRCDIDPEIPGEVSAILNRLSLFPFTAPETITMEYASLAYVGGYIIRTIEDSISCFVCLGNVCGARTSSPLLALISKQDRGALHYPKPALVQILAIIKDFTERALRYISNNQVSFLIYELVFPRVSACSSLSCDLQPGIHNVFMADIICKKFIPLLLTNISKNSTSANEKNKFLRSKPLSRKVLKL